jgi:hypothetical protein
MNDGSSPYVVKIEVTTGDLVDKISFKFSSGVWQHYGSSGGHSVHTFNLREDERLVAIHCNNGDSCDGVKFLTSRGRWSAWYGGCGGRLFKFNAEADHHIIGINSGWNGGATKVIRGIMTESSAQNIVIHDISHPVWLPHFDLSAEELREYMNKLPAWLPQSRRDELEDIFYCEANTVAFKEKKFECRHKNGEMLSVVFRATHDRDGFKGSFMTALAKYSCRGAMQPRDDAYLIHQLQRSIAR